MRTAITVHAARVSRALRNPEPRDQAPTARPSRSALHHVRHGGWCFAQLRTARARAQTKSCCSLDRFVTRIEDDGRILGPGSACVSERNVRVVGEELVRQRMGQQQRQLRRPGRTPMSALDWRQSEPCGQKARLGFRGRRRWALRIVAASVGFRRRRLAAVTAAPRRGVAAAFRLHRGDDGLESARICKKGTQSKLKCVRFDHAPGKGRFEKEGRSIREEIRHDLQVPVYIMLNYATGQKAPA